MPISLKVSLLTLFHVKQSFQLNLAEGILSRRSILLSFTYYTLTMLLRILAGKLLGIVIFAEGKLVGQALIEVKEKEFHITNVLVRKEYRDKGVGKMLIESVLSYLVERRKARRVHLYVEEDNTVAMHLYQEVGFRKEKSLHLMLYEPAYGDLPKNM